MACPATVGLVGVSGVDGFQCGVRGVNLHSTIGTNRWNIGAAQSYGKKGLIASSVAVGMVGAAASSGKCCGIHALNTDNALVYVNWRNGAAHSYWEKGLIVRFCASLFFGCRPVWRQLQERPEMRRSQFRFEQYRRRCQVEHWGCQHYLFWGLIA